MLRALHVLEKAVIPKGKRIGSEKYDEASHEIVKKYHLETSKHKPVCVFGHTHAPVCHDMPSVIHLNTGSWQRGYYEEDGYYIHSPYQGVVYLDPENYPKVRYGRWNRKQFIDLEVV